MIRTPLFAAALMAAPLAFTPALAEPTAANPEVELSITESIDVAPDMATIGTGVSTQAMTASAALEANAQKMQTLIAAIRAKGVKEEDIQTSGISLNPQYDYRPNEEPRFNGYQVSNQLSVKVRDLDKLGSMLDAFVAAGATNLNGPSFTIDDDAVLKRQARDRAFDRAREQAMVYARKAGFRDVRLLSVSEAIRGDRPMEFAEGAPRMAVAKADTPVAPGQVSTGVNVSFRFQMVQ